MGRQDRCIRRKQKDDLPHDMGTFRYQFTFQVTSYTRIRCYIETSQNPLNLWKSVATAMFHGRELNSNPETRKATARHRFSTFRQGSAESVGEFFMRFDFYAFRH
jgi:hypothetical protein